MLGVTTGAKSLKRVLSLGSFADGSKHFKQVNQIVATLRSGKRPEELKVIQAENDLPVQRMQKGGGTRIGSIIDSYKQLCVNKTAIGLYRSKYKTDIPSQDNEKRLKIR